MMSDRSPRSRQSGRHRLAHQLLRRSPYLHSPTLDHPYPQARVAGGSPPASSDSWFLAPSAFSVWASEVSELQTCRPNQLPSPSCRSPIGETPSSIISVKAWPICSVRESTGRRGSAASISARSSPSSTGREGSPTRIMADSRPSASGPASLSWGAWSRPAAGFSSAPRSMMSGPGPELHGDGGRQRTGDLRCGRPAGATHPRGDAGPTTALAGVAGQTTSSLPAFKAYLEGERELRSGRYAEAQEAFRRATELDTTFALAYYRLAMTLGPAPALEALDHALRHSDRLSEHHRWAVEAAAAYFRGDHTLADQRTRQVLTVRPDDAEAWFMYADVTLTKGSLLGRAWVDAREGFERALALDPENADAVWWLAAIAATERRLPALDSLTNRLQQLDAAPWLAVNAQGLRAIMMGDTAGEARFVADLRERPDPWAAPSAGLVAWHDRGSVGRAAPLAADHGAPPLAGIPDDGSRDAGKVRAHKRPLGCREHGAGRPSEPWTRARRSSTTPSLR